MLRVIRAATSTFSVAALAAAGILLNSSPAFADTSGDYSYTDNGDGTATITGYTGVSTDVEIPATLGGLSVTTIGESAFQSDHLTSVIIPDSVTTIGISAFQINDLTSLIIPNSVTTIGQTAFQSNQLTSVVLPDSLTTIGVSAFQINNLTSVTIPDSVTTIAQSAFQTNQLASVSIPDSVTTIGASAFQYNQLASVTIPDSVTTIGASAFMRNQLTSVTIPDSVTTVERIAFAFNQLTSVTVTGTTSFGDGQFVGNPGLIGTLTFLAGPPPNITDSAAANKLANPADVTLRFYPDSGFGPDVWGDYAMKPLTPTSLTVTATPTTVTAGGSATIAVTGTDESGHDFGDVTGQVDLTSSVHSDVIDGDKITFTQLPRTRSPRP